MTIRRHGARRDQGVKEVELRDPKVRWDPKQGCVTISARRVKDFTGFATHNYDLAISLEEVSKVLDALGEVAADETNRLSSSLAPSLRALLRLTLVCAGLVVSCVEGGSKK